MPNTAKWPVLFDYSLLHIKTTIVALNNMGIKGVLRFVLIQVFRILALISANLNVRFTTYPVCDTI